MPPKPNIGRIATLSTIIPMPPIHCINARQSKIECVCAATSVKTVEPVVVNPAIVSYQASVKLGNAPLNQNGNMPKSE